MALLHYAAALATSESRGDRGWTLQNLHFTPYLMENFLHPILGQSNSLRITLYTLVLQGGSPTPSVVSF